MSRETGVEAVSAQSVDQRRLAPAERGAWIGAWLVLVALALWIAQLAIPWLMLAAMGALVWSWSVVRSRNWWALCTALVLWLAIGTGVGVQMRLWTVAQNWEQVQGRLEEEVAGALNDALDSLVERGEQAVSGVADAVVERSPAGPSALLFRRLEGIRHLTGVSAVALLGPDRAPIGWAGEHRGMLPVEVLRGEQDYVFAEGPLFSYLYFVRPLPEGRMAVAAVLLEANLEVGEGTRPFAEEFAGRHGMMPRFSSPDRAQGTSVWDWSTDRPILSVSFAALTQQGWWGRVVERGRRAAGLLWLSGFVLLGVVWYRRRLGAAGLPVAVATLGLLLTPLGEMVGMRDLFSPLQFVLPVPGPWDISLGTLLVLLTGVSVWMLTRRQMPRETRPWPLWLCCLLVLPLFPAALYLVERSAAGGWLANQPGGGFALQLATTLLLAVPLFLLLRRSRRQSRPRWPRVPLLLFGLLLSLSLGVLAVLLWHPERPFPIWAALLWVFPFAVFARVLPWMPARRRTFRVWLLAAWLGASVSLPFLWNFHVGAELSNAELELSRLGTEPDPFLDFLLRGFAEKALYFALEGEQGVNLLYHSWVSSGLAREGYEARLSIWHQGEVETELRLSDAGSIPSVVPEMVTEAAARTDPLVLRYTRVRGLHYLLLVPLPNNRVISVAVPPRYRIGRATALARFLHPQSEREAAASNESLYLVPSTGGPPGVQVDSLEAGPPPVKWLRVENGWRSEAYARFPSGWRHAHLFVRTDSPAMLLVRGLLSLLGLMLSGVLFWLLARMLCGEMPVFPLVRRQWVRSFRGRLTVALFIFFLLPTAFFGAVAYGAVAREVVLSAANLARRALEQAASEVAGTAELGEVAARVQTDLLLYRQGTLVGAAAPEVLDLGLFHTWLPSSVFLEFSSGEDLEEREERQLGENRYLVAYRRLSPSVVLSAPIPLASHEIARRQRDFAHLALLVSLVGAAFSVVLSLLVGRALSRPLAELSQAVATVGAGNLRVQLPSARPDEFGRVYDAFNRMVRRLRRARTALVRETKRTETIVAEAATGVLALDAQGRVELVNPRASQILGKAPVVGESLPTDGALLRAVGDVIAEFWSSAAPESGTELEVEGRVVRLRLRRLSEAQGLGGAVLALEDVTDEVRTARVLAWGEMARQVAHEIKNPLTPIKLSVQHLRRAFADRRPDFDQILERNVSAILQEIDRLGEIARAFSRFGTPQQRTDALEVVDVSRAVEETLALYRGVAGGLRYEVDLPADAPLHAVARMGELKEVLVNLLENAREALDGEGVIRISAAPVGDGRRVEIVVADTGEGIPGDLLPQIFEPHFSTRTSGTGLGLAIVRRLVESWGGEVSAESEPGMGTRVRLLLQTAEHPIGDA